MKHDFFNRDDGLLHCKVCKGAEGDLPTCCPGRELTTEERVEVYAGGIDFAQGPMTIQPCWWKPCEPLNADKGPYSNPRIHGGDDKLYIEGPGDGFGYYAGTLWPDRRFSTEADRNAAVLLCNQAHAVGLREKQLEILKVLGV